MAYSAGPPVTPTPSDNLFFSELPADLTEEQIVNIFGAYGTIASHKFMPPHTGKNNKCAALIRYTTLAEAQWIVENLNGNIPQGMTEPIKVNYKFDSWRDLEKGKSKGKAEAYSPYGGGKGSAAASWSATDAWGGSYAQDSWAQSAPSYGAASGHDSWAAPPPRGGGGWHDTSAWSGQTSAWSGQDSAWSGKGSAWSGQNSAWSSQDVGWSSSSKGDKGSGKGWVSINLLVDGILRSGALPGSNSRDETKNHALFVGGLPHDSTDIDLFRIFSPFGSITPRGINVMKADDGYCKGFAFVNFIEAGAAHKAVSTLNGTSMWDGKKLVVNIKSDKSSKNQGYDFSALYQQKAAPDNPPPPLPDAEPDYAATAQFQAESAAT